MTNDESERDLELLRATVLAPEAVPLGLTARLQTAVVRQARTRAAVGWQARAVVAALGFTVAWTLAGPEASVAFAVVSGVVAAAYAMVSVRNVQF